MAVLSFSPFQGGRHEGTRLCSGGNTSARLGDDVVVVEHDGKGHTERAPRGDGRHWGDSAMGLGEL